MATLEAIQARIKKLEAQAQAIKLKKTGGVIKQIRDLMAQYEITVEDIAASTGKASAKAQVKATQTAAKYADPKTGATWSGRGRAPAWIANARNRDAFLVADGVASARATKPATRKKAKHKKAKHKKATRKGPQPALYRNPVSGLTWSGFGRAPGWIAMAKDRSAFLIEGGGAGGEGGNATKPVAKKGAVAKKSEIDAVTSTKEPKPAAKKGGGKKQTAAKKSTASKKATSAKKASTAKKGTAAKKAAATKSVRSTGTRPARKSRGELKSVTPTVEAPAQDGAIEAANADNE